MSDWDTYFMNIARSVSLRSKDRSTKVGCVLVGPENNIRSTGYNGFPRGINDDAEERHQRPEKYFWTEHAERNAIYAAARSGTSTNGCRIYIPWYPCIDCARALVQAGIVEVVCIKPDTNTPKWGEEFIRSEILFKEANVNIRYYEEKRKNENV